MRTPLLVEPPVGCGEYSCIEEAHYLCTEPPHPFSKDPYVIIGRHTLAFISIGFSIVALTSEMSCTDKDHEASRIDMINNLAGIAIGIGAANLLFNICLTLSVPQKNLEGRLTTHKCVCESAYFFSLASIALGIFTLCYLKGKC